MSHFVLLSISTLKPREIDPQVGIKITNKSKGDSFSAIQRGSGNASYPRRLADWVKEICHIAVQLKCTFIHVIRDATDVADTLARKESAILVFCVVCFYFIFVFL